VSKDIAILCCNGIIPFNPLLTVFSLFDIIVVFSYIRRSSINNLYVINDTSSLLITETGKLITETGKFIAGTGKLNCDGYGLDYNDHCLNCKEACSTAITFSQLQHNYFI
jgi:hypothetical protein